MLGIRGFCKEDEERYLEMGRALRRASQADRKRRKDNENDLDATTEFVRGVINGEANFDPTVNEYGVAMLGWVAEIRKDISKNVIRRTATSIDNKGKPISGLSLPHEHHLVCTLFDQEMEHLESVAREVLEADVYDGVRLNSSGKNVSTASFICYAYTCAILGQLVYIVMIIITNHHTKGACIYVIFPNLLIRLFYRVFI